MQISTNEALTIWRIALQKAVQHEEPDLTARQMSVILSVYLDNKPHRVKNLAQSLGISKPAITRALDRLEGMGYIRRKPDEKDGRSILVQRTVRGSVFLSDFAGFVQEAIQIVGQSSPSKSESQSR